MDQAPSLPERCPMYIDPGMEPRTRAGSADSTSSLYMRKVHSLPDYVIPVYDDRLPIPPPLAAEAWDQKRRRRHQNPSQKHVWPDWTRVYSDPIGYRDPYTPSDTDSMNEEDDGKKVIDTTILRKDCAEFILLRTKFCEETQIYRWLNGKET